MKIYHRKRKIWMLFLLTFTLLLNTSSFSVYAGAAADTPVARELFSDESWTSGYSTNIYGDYDAADVPDSVDDDPGLIEGLFIELVKAIANGVNFLSGSIGLSLDSVVYGRVNGNAGIASFTFELTKGNPYGLVAAIIFQILRGFCYIAIVVMVFARTSLHMYSSNTPQGRANYKSMLSHGVLTFLMLTAMPYLLDVVLYLRDTILYGLSRTSESTGLFGNVSVGLIDMFEDAADSSLLAAFVYFAASIFTFYLAFSYVGIAMSFLVAFVAFPLIAAASNVKRGLLGSWVSQVSYFVAVPIIDATLFLVPAFMLRSHVSGIIVLMSCMSIVPARKLFSNLLGLNSGGSDLMGLGAMIATGRLVGGAVKTGMNFRKRIQDAKEDKEMANYYDDLDLASKGNGTGADSSPISEPTPVPVAPSGGGVSGVASSDSAVNAVQTPMQGSVSTSSPVAEKYANWKNFENPELFKGLSNQKKAELYRERKMRRYRSAYEGLLWAGVGGAFGGSAGLFMGYPAAAMGAGAGMTYGDAFGSARGLNAAIRKSVYNGKVSSETAETAEKVNGEVMLDNLPSTNVFWGTSSSSQPFAPNMAGIEQEYRGAIPDFATEFSYGGGDSSVNIGTEIPFHEQVVEHGLKYKSVAKQYLMNLCSQYSYHSQEEMGRYHDEVIRDMPEQYNILNTSSASMMQRTNARNAMRAEFRKRVENRYNNQFQNAYYNDGRVTVHSNDKVESAVMRRYTSFMHDNLFRPDSNSFVGDKALDSYDWFTF